MLNAGLRGCCEHRVQRVLLCAQHANQALEERLASLKRGERHANGDQPLEHG